MSRKPAAAPRRRPAPGLVIVGNSVAGTAALEAFRARDAATPVTVIAREPLPSYSRPLIHDPAAPGLRYRDRAFYRRLDAAVVHAAAERIDPRRRTVHLAGGKAVGYDRLLLAVGGRPVVPKFAVDAPGKLFTFTTRDDARRLAAATKGKRTAVVVGCGMIGIKAAEFLRSLRLAVTIVELQDRPFAGVLDPPAAALVAARLREHADLVLNESVVAVTRAGVRLRGGATLPADVVVAAVGVVPDLALAATAGLKTDRGILVDERLQTSDPRIWAAGDCVAALDIVTGERRPIPVWPLAARQGRVAGTVLAGGEARYDGGFLLNSVDVFGLPVITLGASVGEQPGRDESFSVSRAGDSVYKKIVVRDNRVVGAIFVEEIDRAGIITGLIRDRVDVGGFKADLLRDDFGYIYVPREFRSREVAPEEI